MGYAKDDLYDEKPRGSSTLLYADVERGFVVRTSKHGAKRGGLGAVRIRETYMRTDNLLMAVSDTVLGGSSSGSADGGEKRPPCYVCPSADFLHCYLELLERPELRASFEGAGGGVPPRCALLLLHSELSKLTGASGALTIRQEKRLVQLTRALPGTMIFFDKFCPDLHRGSSSSSSSTSFTRDEHASLEQTSGAQSNEISRLKAACRWCRAELGCPSVVILSDDDDDDDLSGERLPGPSEAFREGDAGTTPRTRDSDDGFWGPAPAARPREAVRVSGLEEFVREFVGRGEREAELLRRGALLFSAYQAMKAEPRRTRGSSVGRGTRTGASPLLLSHPSRVQLEALVASGEALKGRLDVLEHNPREAFVLVRGAGGDKIRGGGDAGGLEGWADERGNSRVLVVGREGMNRSIHGDTVALRLLPRRRWRAPADRHRLTHVPEEDSGADDLAMEGSLETEASLSGGDGKAPPGAVPTGVVVGVLEEGRRPYVVTVPAEEASSVQAGIGAGASGSHILVVPMDPRVPKIRIKTRQLAQLCGQRLVATVDEWELGSTFPTGHYVSSLGPVGEVSTEAAALLVECQASFEPFSFNALTSLPKVPRPPKESQRPRDVLLPPATLAQMERPEDGFGKAPRWEDSGWRVQESDLHGRRDLRGVRAISVDPPGCQDIDDAMHVRRTSDGKLEVGVHIADVTRFVPLDGPVDKEARARATTVYLVHRRIDMLPALLSSDLCSLHALRDRLSVSVLWEVEEDGEDIRISRGLDGAAKCWFGRTAIHSVASMTYDQAHSLVETGSIVKPSGHAEPPPGQAGRDVEESLQPGLAHDLRLLTRFARTMRKERTRNGAIDLAEAGAELKFKIDPATGTPLTVAGKEEKEIHHTIAELMILANSHVAQKIHGSFPSASLVRVHAPPDSSKLSAFEGVAEKIGVAAKHEGRDGGKNVLAESLATVEGGGNKGKGGKEKAGLLKSLAVRAMSEAEYVSTGALSIHEADGKQSGGDRFAHFGLGLSFYTHFTSPIRRYADIVVHRLLLAALEDTDMDGVTAAENKGWTTSALSTGDIAELVPSMAPSVLDMEAEALGKAHEEAAVTRATLRAGAGDASFVANPDGTRTYNKVSMAALPTTSGLPHPTGKSSSTVLPSSRDMNAFPALPNPVGDGDDLLDELLGLDVPNESTAPSATATTLSWETNATPQVTVAAVSGNSSKNRVIGDASTAFNHGKTGGRVQEATTWRSPALGVARDTGGVGGARGAVEREGSKTASYTATRSRWGKHPAISGDEGGESGRCGGRGTGDLHGKDGDLDIDELLDFDLLAVGAETRDPGVTGVTGRETETAFLAPTTSRTRDPATVPPETVAGDMKPSDQGTGFRADGDAAREVKGEEGVEDENRGDVQSGSGASVASPPFEGAELGRLCTHLNDRNRRAKRLSQECQEMFLRLFFKDHTQVVQALVLSLRANGFIAYVPAFDAKGPVYLSDKDGNLQVDPALLGLPDEAGLPPSKGFAAQPRCRIIPGARVSLSMSTRRDDEKDEELLEVLPPESGGRAMRLKVLDGVMLRLSCEVLPTQARLPKVRFLLAGVGIRDVSTRQQQRMRQPADTVSVSGQPQGSGSISSGRRMGSELEKVRAMAGVPKGSEGTGSGGLYGLLQASLDQAIWESLPSPSRHEERPEGVPGAPSGRVQHGFSSGGGGHERKEKKEKKVGKGESSGRGDPQRSEIGAGRALFGGFVPLRHAPAASLFDSDSGVGAGEGSPQGGGYGGGYESIYRTGDGRSSGSRYAAAAGGTLASLDDAKIRQYAQEATARAQRLNAEKRNARVARSKRQG